MSWGNVISEYLKEKEVKSYVEKLLLISDKITPCTHVAKYTHSDSKASSINAKINHDDYEDLELDLSGNGAYIGYMYFLKLKYNSKSILEHVQDRSTEPFISFYDQKSSQQIVDELHNNLFSEEKLKSHYLSKQVYFPVEDDEYHILSPVFPSSENYKNQEVIKEKARENKFFSSSLVEVHFGGSKPHNISYLNSRLNGKTLLLSNSAPSLKSVIVTKEDTNIFNSESFYPFVAHLKVNKRDKISFLENITEIFDALVNFKFSIDPSSDFSLLKYDHQRKWLKDDYSEDDVDKVLEKIVKDILMFFAVGTDLIDSEEVQAEMLNLIELCYVSDGN